MRISSLFFEVSYLLVQHAVNSVLSLARMCVTSFYGSSKSHQEPRSVVQRQVDIKDIVSVQARYAAEKTGHPYPLVVNHSCFGKPLKIMPLLGVFMSVHVWLEASPSTDGRCDYLWSLRCRCTTLEF